MQSFLRKISLLIPVFLPIALSTLFHLGFAKFQKGKDYNDLVLFLSISAVISTLLLLGKELEYYQENKNVNSLIYKDFFTLLIGAIVVSCSFYIFYEFTENNFVFKKEFILLIPLKVLVDYFVIILNVKDKARFVRYTFDILFGVIQVSLLGCYIIGFIKLNSVILFILLFFLVLFLYYVFVLKIDLKKVKFRVYLSYFKFGKALISGLGSFVAKFQFILMSIVAPELIGMANIAFTIANTISIPYNYLTKLRLPSVLKNNSSFKSNFFYVRNYSLLFSSPVLLFILFFVLYNPFSIEYLEERGFVYFLMLYILAAFIDILVGLKSSMVQVLIEPSKIVPYLILVLIISVSISYFNQGDFIGVGFYVAFIILSNLFFIYKYKKCFQKRVQ
ncbi:hypothetical protein F7018_17295 [Tenacibaculum aiptasiae]|uniref:Uncharacterized protein n=1 Tax=Tenacibaculum aiptasiae TaxID=426481 RepID=A0A7J5A6U5_9FLAO|nr:hypothetical protein [Tenacibaculum aiptasiae]KAB1153276.1 hypothetical protein F7018_17295 [Tenacibaculum aiptasiae]